MNHVDVTEADPDSLRAMLALTRRARASAEAAGLDDRLLELVEVRVSQINGCAFCLRMHVAAAVEAGETADRLAVLAGWWESRQFTERERAALQLAETLTLVGDPARADRGIDPRAVLDDALFAAVTWTTVVINAWNRITIASHTSDIEELAAA